MVVIQNSPEVGAMVEKRRGNEVIMILERVVLQGNVFILQVSGELWR
jgi:hypothetical protein